MKQNNTRDARRAGFTDFAEGNERRRANWQNHGRAESWEKLGGYFSQINLVENARIFAIALRRARRYAKVGDQSSVSSYP
jgi:hypothetical protein